MNTQHIFYLHLKTVIELTLTALETVPGMHAKISQITSFIRCEHFTHNLSLLLVLTLHYLIHNFLELNYPSVIFIFMGVLETEDLVSDPLVGSRILGTLLTAGLSPHQ